MQREEVEDVHNVVTDTFSIKTGPIHVLFDSGATHYFDFAKLIETSALYLISKRPILHVALPYGKTM